MGFLSKIGNKIKKHSGAGAILALATGNPLLAAGLGGMYAGKKISKSDNNAAQSAELGQALSGKRIVHRRRITQTTNYGGINPFDTMNNPFAQMNNPFSQMNNPFMNQNIASMPTWSTPQYATAGIQTHRMQFIA